MRRRIFLAFVFLVLIPVGITIILVGQLFSSFSREMTIDYIRSATGSTRRVLETHLQNYEELTMQLYYNEQVFFSIGRKDPQGDAEISRLLQSIVNSDRHVSSVYLFADGHAYAEGTMFRNMDAILERYRDAIIEAKGELIWTPVQTLTSTFAWPYEVFVAMRALRRDDRVVGFLVIAVRREMIDAATAELQRVAGSAITIYDQDRDRVYAGAIGESPILVAPDFSRMAGTRGFYTTQQNGSKHYVVYETVDTSGWLLVTQITDGPALATLRSALNVIWIVLAGLGIALLVVVYVLSRAVTRPLRELDAALKRTAAGDLSVRLDEQGLPEIAGLIKQFNTMTIKIGELIEDVREQSFQKNQAELRSLRLQLSPHFLYNTLNTVRWMATVNGQRGIRDVIESLIHLLQSMSKIGDESIPLRTELQLLHSYVKIQSFRYDDFHYVEDVSKKVLDYCVPPFILQPLVENSIVHAFARRSADDTVTVRAYETDGKLQLVVEDNGIGIDAKEPGVSSGISENMHMGLRNVDERVRLRYGPTFGLEISGEFEAGTRVTVTLPLESNRGNREAV